MASKITDERSFFHTLAESLRRSARAPNIHGYQPHPKQEDFHLSPARGRQFIGGNRSGKTVAGAAETVYWLTGKHPFREIPPPPIRGRVVAVDFDQGVEKIVKPEIAKWMPLSELRGGSWDKAFDKKLRTLHMDNGSFVEFMSYDQDLDKFAGTSRHFTWFDEEPPEEIYDECMMRLLDTGGHWWMSMTPVEGMTWTAERIYDESSRNPNIYVVEVETDENIYLNPAEIDMVMAGLSKEDQKARRKGLYVHKTGLIYRHFSPEVHVISPFKLSPSGVPPKDWLWVAAMDHGYNNPTAWGWFAVNPEGDYYLFDEHYESGRVVSYHAEEVLKRNLRHGHEPAYNVGDPSIRNTDPISGTSVQIEYMEHGVPIILGNNDVPAGIQRMATMIGEPPFDGNRKPKFYVTENCVNFIEEIKKYRWDSWMHKKVERNKNAKEAPVKKNDHMMDMARYFFASRPKYEDASYVPEANWEEFNARMGFSKAVDPEHRIDEGLTRSRSTTYTDIDFTLGGEW